MTKLSRGSEELLFSSLDARGYPSLAVQRSLLVELKEGDAKAKEIVASRL